jgi:hypothetical protein
LLRLQGRRETQEQKTCRKLQWCHGLPSLTRDAVE